MYFVLLMHTLGGDNSSSCISAMHMGELDGVPSSWLRPGQHQLCQAFEGLNQGIQELFLSVSLPVSKIKDKIKIDYTVFQLEHSRKQSGFLRLGFFFIYGSSLHMPAFRIQGLTV